MVTTRKRMKFLKESETLKLEDRISNLPKEIIVHILSFLPTKYAVGTSILSKFWKNQWTSVPNLDLDDTLLMDSRKSYWIQPRFLDFARRVLDHHKAPQLCQFRLKCHQFPLSLYLDSWIPTVLARNVRKLELYLFGTGLDFLPCEIFTCGTLVELILGSGFLLNIPSLVCLPNLRAIYLCLIEFVDYESFNRLFSCCPVLEDVSIIYGSWGNEIALNISSPTVKRLTVDSSHSDQFPIDFTTRHLLHKNYARQLEEGFLPKFPEFLAKVYFHYPSNLRFREIIKAVAQGISNIQFLYLSAESLETLNESRLEIPPLLNLRTLVIGYNRNGAWKMLPQLLEKCPNLKYLELNDGYYGQERRPERFKSFVFRWVRPKVVPACLVTHLEGIKVHEFKGHADEMEIINYLLINTKVLKKLTVISAMNARRERSVHKKLLTFTRDLLDCEVVVS